LHKLDSLSGSISEAATAVSIRRLLFMHSNIQAGDLKIISGTTTGVSSIAASMTIGTGASSKTGAEIAMGSTVKTPVKGTIPNTDLGAASRIRANTPIRRGEPGGQAPGFWLFVTAKTRAAVLSLC